MDAPDLTLMGARVLLNQYALWCGRRDEIVRRTHAAGVSVSEIARTTGHSRTTIDRILNGQESHR